MPFYFDTKFGILSPLNVMNRFMLEQRWDLLEIYFQNKEKRSEIRRNCRTKFDSQEGPIALGIRKFIAEVCETDFVVMWQTASVFLRPDISKLWTRVIVKIHQHQLVIALLN